MTSVVLLTATIAPPAATRRLAIRDPEARRAQYLSALSHWGQLAPSLGATIVLADNSPSTTWLDDLAAAVADRPWASSCRFEHVDAGATDTEKGKAEAAIIDACVESGWLGGADRFVKCTGRLWVPNARRCIEPDDGAWDVALRPSLTWADSRFFAVPAEDAARLLGMGADVDEEAGVFLEHALARRTLDAVRDGAAFRGFVQLPLIRGVSGSTGDRYGARRKVLVRAARARARSLLRARQTPI